MTTCDYRPVAADYWQLQQGDPNGGDNCTAYAGAMAAAYDSCGKWRLEGAAVRAATNEPQPDPQSPGLNLPQVRDAVRKLTRGEVELHINVGSVALSWDEYERRRLAGHGLIAQIDYSAIAASQYSGDPHFHGGHAIFETRESTYDPLADGRRPGVFRYNGTVYPRSLIKKAAGDLVLGKSGARAGFGTVWCALTDDKRTEPLVIDYGRNQMISASGYDLSSRLVMDLKRGEPLRRDNSPTAPVVTKMSADGAVQCFGNAGNGMRAVLVTTSGGYSDGVKRPTLLYVRAAASGVRPR